MLPSVDSLRLRFAAIDALDMSVSRMEKRIGKGFSLYDEARNERSLKLLSDIISSRLRFCGDILHLHVLHDLDSGYLEMVY
jgi:hypothetical protein